MTRRACMRDCLGAALGLANWWPALGASSAWAAEAVQAAGAADVMADLQRFLGSRSPLDIQDFGGPFSRRDVVEAVLLHQALHRGGWTQALQFQDMPSGERLLREISSGKLICSATTYWSQDIAGAEDGTLLSLPMIGVGEFEAGLYTVPSNTRALAAKSAADVRALSVVSNRNWAVDWQTLEALGFRQRHHVTNWELMPRMVAAGRADFLLAPFQNSADLSLQVNGVRLQPIPGFKVSLQGTRHYLIARKHPQGMALLGALNSGLQQLRAQGVIHNAYQQSGFFNPKVRGWQKL
ncbi:hypothetical protein AT984_16560 [Paucibacter sp. KCTC 42545]|nr:hypothetical protein AT984_16560 [Paucibacter sp. KCTC 42545]